TRVEAKRVKAARVIERANSAAASDPSQLLELVARQPFTERDLRELVARFTPSKDPYAISSADDLLTMKEVIRLNYPKSGTGSPWYTTSDLRRADHACVALAETLMKKPFSGGIGKSLPMDGPVGS